MREFFGQNRKKWKGIKKSDRNYKLEGGILNKLVAVGIVLLVIFVLTFFGIGYSQAAMLG